MSNALLLLTRQPIRPLMENVHFLHEGGRGKSGFYANEADTCQLSDWL